MDHCEMVAPQIYKVTVPLPDNPLRALNSYFVTAPDRLLIVDLGFDRPESVAALSAAVEELGYTWEQVDLFLTHSHPDHTGAINRVWRPGMKVYAGFPDFATIHESYFTHVRGFRAWMADGYELLPAGEGQPVWSAEEAAVEARGEFDVSGMGDIVIPDSPAPITVLHHGDRFVWGEREFEVIHVQGHDPWHLCLFAAADGVLISGDQVLERITPNIVTFALGEQNLGHYIASLDVLERYQVTQVLTGHRNCYADMQGRINQLRQHHEERTQEMLAAIRGGAHTVKDIARTVTWRNPIPNWDDWPAKQKYFSIGETIAHLGYLEARGLVTHEIRAEQVFFALASENFPSEQ